MLSSIKDNHLQEMVTLFTHISVIKQGEQEAIKLQQKYPSMRNDFHKIVNGFFQELLNLRDEVNQQL